MQLAIDHNTIERRKQLRRDLWDYRPVDHIPVVIWLNHLGGHTYREWFESPDVHLEVNLERIRKSLALLPDDYIPFTRMVRGPMTIANMFGADIAWTDDPQEAPGPAGPILADLADVWRLTKPHVTDGIMADHLQRIRQHAAALPPDVYLTGIFAGGPLQVAADLVESKAFYAGFYDDPAALHHLLDMVTELQSRSTGPRSRRPAAWSA